MPSLTQIRATAISLARMAALSVSPVERCYRGLTEIERRCMRLSSIAPRAAIDQRRHSTLVLPLALFIARDPWVRSAPGFPCALCFRSGETKSKARTDHVARIWNYDPLAAQHIRCRPGLEPGPITTNAQCCATPWPQPFFSNTTLWLWVPAFAGTTIVDGGRAIHSLSSWRKPGPITPNANCLAMLGPPVPPTTQVGGYGSRLSPGRRIGRIAGSFSPPICTSAKNKNAPETGAFCV
ncbi:hypothetical protein M2222_005324 [Bradyrhizobium elkanii]|nr:hypothetical protein [Bradyrhizobium elkanii]MCS3563002.1 hypothetical protein [Bradyrhizobium elkanii]MCW2147162.1 hypothetical protein [Bradyrhizobium elkanii]MCW2353760.1 hypothetical protein [Bradyrhizobium elkanii]MCW2379993.1 hypothetical protein [Bradyrhizobium elkanii]